MERFNPNFSIKILLRASATSAPVLVSSIPCSMVIMQATARLCSWTPGGAAGTTSVRTVRKGSMTGAPLCLLQPLEQPRYPE